MLSGDLGDDVGPTDYIDLSTKYGFSLVHMDYTETNDTYCFIAVKGDAGDGNYARFQVVIAFRGTASLENAKVDLRFNRTRMEKANTPQSETLADPSYGRLEGRERPTKRQLLDDMLKQQVQEATGGAGMVSENHHYGKVHAGFAQSYNGVRPGILKVMADISSRLNKRKRAGKKHHFDVYCTGHSLGGALATLCAFDLSVELGLKPQMYNFGSPRVMDHAFSKVYNISVPLSFRLVFDRDVITAVPKFLFLYKHIGLEIIIDSLGNCIMDPSWVENFFRSSRRSIKDHQMSSYRQGLEACLAWINSRGAL